MAVYSKQAQRVRAIQFVKEKAINHLTNVEIAEKYGVDPRTVSRVLTFAERAKIFVEIEDQLLNEFAPIAMDALKAAMLQTDDPEVASKIALEVLKGLNIIKKNHVVTQKDVKDQDDLASYIGSLRGAEADQQKTVEGVVLADSKALPPAPDEALLEEPDAD